MQAYTEVLAEFKRNNINNARRLVEQVIAQSSLDAGLSQKYADMCLYYGQIDLALEFYNLVTNRSHCNVDAFVNRIYCLTNLGRGQEAVELAQVALKRFPGNKDVVLNRANALELIGNLDEAERDYRALLNESKEARIFYNLGRILYLKQDFEEALTYFLIAKSDLPNAADIHQNIGAVLLKLGRYEESVAASERALQLNPNGVSALSNLGHALCQLKGYQKAVQAFNKIYQIDPDYSFVKGQLLHAKMLACDWSGLDSLYGQIKEGISHRQEVAEPFGMQAISQSPEELRICAEVYGSKRYPQAKSVSFSSVRRSKSKIRLGYCSGEFRAHATSVLITEVFELHNKDLFELWAFDSGWDDGSDLRKRQNAAFDHIVSVKTLSDVSYAKAVVSNEIDILINLNGYFGISRLGAFALRPAPIQVNFLGFPGTFGLPYFDYIIADRLVLPESHHSYYAERVVYLDGCYQPNDRKRPNYSDPFTRTDNELPAEGFVFACFNNNYKILPEIFQCWLRLLKSVPGSILWLLKDSSDVEANLVREAVEQGVDEARLVFAPRSDYATYMSRYRHVDLFLDTFPYNAHTTASDALWMGVPIVTLFGNTFPSRVGLSLLTNLGLSDFATQSISEYEALSLKLALDKEFLLGYRNKLKANKHTTSLFDTERYTRNLECCYEDMFSSFVRIK